MFEALNHNVQVIVSIISLGLLVAIYFAFKFRIDLWWLNFWYGLPFIGKLAKLSKDTTRYNKDKSWTQSERTLCDDYKRFVYYLDQPEFKKRLEYLRKAGDLGRSPMPAWMLILLAPLVVAEGLGFSYLLGTWMAMEGSENTHQILMVAIVFVLAVVLLIVTHVAGHELYHTNLIRKCNKEWRDDGQPGKFLSKSKTLDDDQHSDDGEPHYTQCVNRIGDSGSYHMVVVAVIAIVFISVGSTMMRWKHLETAMAQETTGVSTEAASGNPFGDQPTELAAPQVKAEAQAKQDIEKSTKQEGLAAFLMLAFIFVITQIVGIWAGMKWGFAGKHSKDAYKSIRGHSTYDDFIRFYEPIIQNAQSKLQTLQQAMSKEQSNRSLELNHSFMDYLHEKHQEHQAHKEMGTVARPYAANVISTSSNQPSFEEALAIIEGMGEDKEKKKNYINGLPKELRDKVVPELKQRKAEKEAAELARADKELDDVL